MNQYAALRKEQEKEIDAFPFMWAFSQKQFEEGMAKLGLEPTDTDKIYSIGNGGYIRKTDAKRMGEMFTRHTEQMQAAINADPTGEGFVADMFLYEMDNHEYSYTHDIEPVLEALGLTAEEVTASKKLRHGLYMAQRGMRRKG